MSQTLYVLRIERRDVQNGGAQFGCGDPLGCRPKTKVGELVVVPSDKDSILKLAHEQLIDIINSELSAKDNEDIFLNLNDIIKREPDPTSPSSVLYEVYFSSVNDLVHPVIIYTLSLVSVHLDQHGHIMKGS